MFKKTFKLFIAQPMHCCDEDLIRGQRAAITKVVTAYVKDVHFNDAVFEIDINTIDQFDVADPDDFEKTHITERSKRMYRLGRSLQYLGGADFAVFYGDWMHARGCVVEYIACCQYQIPIVSEKTLIEFCKGHGEFDDEFELLWPDEFNEFHNKSDYNSFLASINQKPKLNLNARYGLTTIPIHEAAARVVADAIKAAGDSLLCQSWHRYPGQEDDINCILNGPRNINKEENNMFAEIKTYVADKVVNLIEKFIGGACDDVVKRFVSPAKDDFWWAVTWNNGRFTRFGFRFDDAPNTLMFYELDGYSRKTNCYLWEYPHRIIDVSPHPTMTGALMRELWEFINWAITMTKIQSKYERFISSVTHGERYKYLNALYGSTSMSLDEETKKANILKGLSESLEMPIITESQSCMLSSYNNGKKITIMPDIKSVFFNEVKKTTTVVFNDHTSIIVKCTDKDEFDPEMGLAMALARKCFGSRSKFQKAVAKWVATSAPKNEQLKKESCS